MKTLIILGIFSGLGAKIGWGVAGVASAFGIVKKWGLIVDKAAKFITKWSNTIGIAMQVGSKLLFSVRDTSQKIDDAIAEDGSTSLNTLKEALELGKNVKLELEDMIVIFKPKK